MAALDNYYTSLPLVKEDDRVLQFFSFSFDGSISETIMTLLCGATLVFLPEEIKNNYRKLLVKSMPWIRAYNPQSKRRK